MTSAFDFRQDEFAIKDLQNALILAQMSDLAYKDEGVVESELLKIWSAKSARFIESGETQCFLASFSDGLILSFRGTDADALRDWLTDMDTAKVPGPWGRVHRGFSEALDEVWGEVIDTLKEFQSDTLQPLWVTGHSLGGAVAVLASARLHAGGRRVKGLYTFGQPRVGNAAFAEAFGDRVVNMVRFVNNEDIVPRVPWFDYEHAGDKCYFDRNKKALLNPDSATTWIDYLDEVNFRSLDVDNRFLNQHPNCIGDHSLDRYIACIKYNMPSVASVKPYGDFLNYVNR